MKHLDIDEIQKLNRLRTIYQSEKVDKAQLGLGGKCKECNGTGLITQSGIWRGEFCEKCNGLGYSDWLTHILDVNKEDDD